MSQSIPPPDATGSTANNAALQPWRRIMQIDLDRFEVDPALARRLPEPLSRRLQALLLEEREDNTCLVGMVNPDNLRAQDELSLFLRRAIDVVRVSAEQWSETVDRLYGKSEQIGAFAREVLRNVDEVDGVVDLAAIGQAIDDNEAPVVRLLQTIFDEAAQTGASDIHIEPQEKALRVRFRVDGALHVELTADLKIAAALNVRLKLMAGLDIAERRVPQDGRFAVRSGKDAFDVRMSTLPSLYGESAVLRVLRQGHGVIDLAESGMPPSVLGKFRNAIRAPNGIVLVTGPTGSGKTTTLYAALQALNTAEVKILTCEDPVEYRLDGLVQVQVKEKAGLSFARVLRSFLRQDPDIIFIGEIRDQETAQIATRAAMTGHLVLSTLHTNGAASTPRRLIDMGVPAYMIASTLLCVVSQRLVRLLCPPCKQRHRPLPEEQIWLDHLLGAASKDIEVFHGTGCKRCRGVGYSGRAGVFEILQMNQPLGESLHAGNAVEFERAATAEMGEDTLARGLLKRIMAGETSVAEAMTVLRSGDA